VRGPLLVIVLVAAACAPAATPAPAAPPVDVRIVSTNDFSLHAITVPLGGSVRWTNDSAVTHTVTFTDALRIPADNGTFNKRVEPAASVTRTFPAAGTYAFFCMIHPGMQGTITVGPP
jgi:plastocyanin